MLTPKRLATLHYRYTEIVHSHGVFWGSFIPVPDH